MKFYFLFTISGLSLEPVKTAETPHTLPKQISSLPALFRRPMVRKYNSIAGMTHIKTKTKISRDKFGQRLRKYGCHCFPRDDKAAGGVGPPIDELDQLCKELYQCHRCVNIEFPDDNIDVNDGRYSWDLITGDQISCDNNRNFGRKALCQCDLDFAEKVGKLWQEQDLDSNFNFYYWLNEKNQKNRETFSYEDTCVNYGNKNKGQGNLEDQVMNILENVGNQISEEDPENEPVNPNNSEFSPPVGIPGHADSCCGDGFPNMRPYDSSIKSCCMKSASIFSNFMQECCDDGSVASIGMC